MSAATVDDSGPAEAAKDRTSIKLMDLPMQPKKKKVPDSEYSHTTSIGSSSNRSNNNQQDFKNATTAGVSAELAVAEATASATTTTLPSSSSSTSTSTSTESSSGNRIESGSALSFLVSEDSEQQHQQQQQNQLQQSYRQQQEETNQVNNNNNNGDSSSQLRYETREERQIRIRKQFNQLDQQRSGFLDANSLVGFFAEVTPDKNVQKRYADELLQLCHSRRSEEHGNGNGNDNGNSVGIIHGSSGNGDDDQDSVRSDMVHDDCENNSNDNNDDNKDGDSDSRSDESSDGYQHNGQVRYDDFEVFVEEKEDRLWSLFREIDHNNDNEIQPEELQASLVKAGINLSDADLRRFIKAMDKDGDGMIDFEEWRDFLVLLPRETTLREIFHYVQEVIAQVGVDGDVVMPPTENDYVARYLLAGAIAGAVSRTATAPLDRLKVYLITNSMPVLTGQVAQNGLKYIPKFSSPRAVNPVKQRLLWNAIKELYHQGGVKTFFRGNGLNIIKIAPESAIKFYTYETSKSFIVNHLPSLCIQPHHHHHPDATSNLRSSGAKTHQHLDIATSGRFLAGGIAGLISQFSIYPLETIKTRIMSSTGRSQGGQGVPLSSSSSLSATSLSPTATGTGIKRLSMRVMVREIWQKTGLRGFYRGLGPSLVGIFPYAAIDLSVFETLKFGYMRWKAGLHEGDEGSEEKALERPSVFVLLACGTISGSVGATSVYPLSLVRTRLQAQGTPQHPQMYTSTLDVFRKTYEKEGIRGFYKGMVPTLTKVVPAVSISYVVYEYSKRELGL
ncbi:hypothetical protein BGZ65_000693 [Modicella reniformis]|uniref:EF-hand domain-containing protein n=1 Tax=Modicella reniformis TaxID=1440133 RepID=A0A9P6J2D0_9FUNG|nr:hypothetical protein BGZ65_000693 [Modicella reniformis]